MTTSNERTNVNESLQKAEEVARAAAGKALSDRGVVRPEELLASASPAVILAWCRWWDGQRDGRRDVGTALLAERIKSGDTPPAGNRRLLDAQKAYSERAAQWLVERMPEVCGVDPQIIAWERRLYDGTLADHLERDRNPNPAALATLFRLHQQHGKGTITVRQHGPAIRAAAKAFNDQAIADYRLIEEQRRIATDQTPRQEVFDATP